MAMNVLVTGAGGYIGGSIVADFANGKEGVDQRIRVHAAVRSKDQAGSMSGLNVKVLQVDLSDSEAIEKYVLENEIDMIINTATSTAYDPVANLIAALGKRKDTTGKETIFIHTSGMSAFDKITGWPHGHVNDSDSVYEKEKTSTDSYIVRQVDTMTIDRAQQLGVTQYTVMPPTIHGRGSGSWNQLSPQLPGLIKASIARKQVYRFAEERSTPVVRISELTTFFALLVNAILDKKPLPKNEAGYYFPIPEFSVSWWTLLEHLARALHARGLVDKPTCLVWPSDEEAADTLGVPVRYAHSIFNVGLEATTENTRKVGWRSAWTEERFLKSLDDEIDDVLELGEPKSSLLSSIKPGTQK